jgi:hypothetical protein
MMGRYTAWCLAALSLGSAAGKDAVYQYSAPVGARRAYLWIPPGCRQVRGVMMAMSNLLERAWLEDPIIRDVAAAECLGSVWLGPLPGGARAPFTADLRPGSEAALEQMLCDLAAESGYGEIVEAPIVSMGHSANGQLAWNIPNWKPERTIAGIAIKTVPLPALEFTGVPLLYLVGQTTEWPQYRDGRPGDRDFFWPVVRDSALALRGTSESNFVGVVTDPGSGHFDWSERQARFVALDIRKACRYRLPADGSHKLKSIDARSGWLTGTGGMEPDKFSPAPYEKYRGDPKKAYWFFDEETARAAAAFEGDRKPRQRQMLTFLQDGAPLPVARQGFAALRFEPEADGVGFRVAGTFLAELPPELIGAGTPLGHARGPIKFRVITGPAVQVAPDRFRIQFNRGSIGGDLWIQEEQAGDSRYRHAVQPGQMTIPARVTNGKPQRIAFPEIPSRKARAGSIELKATSDSGLPVDYYVVAGPAELPGSRLTFTKIPASSRYPVKVTVVAYQWGRTIAPLVQSAEPVEQTFWIER